MLADLGIGRDVPAENRHRTHQQIGGDLRVETRHQESGGDEVVAFLEGDVREKRVPAEYVLREILDGPVDDRYAPSETLSDGALCVRILYLETVVVSAVHELAGC